MKKITTNNKHYLIIILTSLICFAYSTKVSAQTLYEKNTTNTFDVDVFNIIKWGATCGGSSSSSMSPMNALPGGSSSQPYPTGFGGSDEIEMDAQYNDPGATSVFIQYCGIAQFNLSVPGSSPAVEYDIYPSGGGTSILVYFHYP